MDTDMTHQEISTRAYFIWKNTGCNDSIKNWYQAQHELTPQEPVFWSQTAEAAMIVRAVAFADEEAEAFADEEAEAAALVLKKLHELFNLPTADTEGIIDILIFILNSQPLIELDTWAKVADVVDGKLAGMDQFRDFQIELRECVSKGFNGQEDVNRLTLLLRPDLDMEMESAEPS